MTSAAREPVRVGIVGVGGWGRNLVRTFHQLPAARVVALCDLDPQRLGAVGGAFPGPRLTTRVEELLDDPALEAVVVATPARTHYPLCRATLEAGKDLFVEKPFVLSVADAEVLSGMAEASGRVLMVGHILVYHPVLVRLREMIRAGDLGTLHYIYSQRLNLGTVRDDENALWSLAPHDVASVLHLLDEEPTDVTARGQGYLRPGIEDVAFVSLGFGARAMAHLHVSWLDPNKVRRLTIVGSARMAVFDDWEPSEKLRLYDKGAAWSTDYTSFAQHVALRFGDVVAPYVPMDEPLRLECQHFLDCVRERRRPRSDGREGVRVVRVLAAAQRSLRQQGMPVRLDGDV